MPGKDLLFTEMDLNPFAETSSNTPEDMNEGESTAEYMSRKEAERRAAEAAKKAAEAAKATAGITDESSRMIEETYDPVIKDFGQQIKDWEEERKRLKEQDETAQRRSRSMKMIAGISDGLTALSNLIGVAGVKGAHASNQQLTGALPALSERFERARLERKADIKTIGDRVEQAQRQFDALRLQKGQSLAELDAQERIAEAKLASEEKERQQKWAEFLLGEQGRDRRAALAAASREMVAGINASKPSKHTPEYEIFVGRDGKQIKYDVSNINFEAASRAAIDAAIKAEKESGTPKDFTPEEIKNFFYWDDSDAGDKRAKDAFYRKYRNHPLVYEYITATGANNPKYK